MLRGRPSSHIPNQRMSANKKATHELPISLHYEDKQGHLKVEAFYHSCPVFRVSPAATHEKQEKRVFARITCPPGRVPRAPARGLLPLATPLSRLLNRPASYHKSLDLLVQ